MRRPQRSSDGGIDRQDAIVELRLERAEPALDRRLVGVNETEGVMRKFVAKHAALITGTLSCFDRVLFKGHLPLGCGHRERRDRRIMKADRGDRERVHRAS